MNKLLATIFMTAFLLQAFATAEDTADDIRAAIDDERRKAADKERDAARKPAEVLAFLGVEPGMVVMDVMASGGWYTEVLSFAVGDNGRVYAQNTPAFLQYRDGMYEKAIADRLRGNRLKNVTEQAGFEAVRSDLLANSEDDHSAMVFAPEIRGKTDRFLLKLTKL
jgi:predicted methyltransferase